MKKEDKEDRQEEKSDEECIIVRNTKQGEKRLRLKHSRKGKRCQQRTLKMRTRGGRMTQLSERNMMDSEIWWTDLTARKEKKDLETREIKWRFALISWRISGNLQTRERTTFLAQTTPFQEKYKRWSFPGKNRLVFILLSRGIVLGLSLRKVYREVDKNRKGNFGQGWNIIDDCKRKLEDLSKRISLR